MTRPGRTGDFWPDPAGRELLEIALGEQGDVVAIARRLGVRPRGRWWLGPDERTALVLAARRSPPSDPSVARSLHSLRLGQRGMAATHLAEATQAIATLRDAGIEALLVKGAALGPLYYPEPGIRAMADVDVVVPPPAAVAAVEVLTEAGWMSRDWVGPRTPRFVHGVALVAGTTSLDLHWRLHEYLTSHGGDGITERAFSRAIDIGDDGQGARTLGPADHLHFVLVHGARWRGGARLRWVLDAVHIVRGAGADIDWEVLVADAVEAGTAPAVAEALDYISAWADLPAGVIDRLRTCPGSWRGRIGWRMTASRPPRRAVTAWTIVGHYLRTTSTWSVPQASAAIPTFFAESWGVDGPRALPRAVLSRIRGRDSAPQPLGPDRLRRPARHPATRVDA